MNKTDPMHMERRRRTAAVSREKAAAKPAEAQKIERRKAWQFFYEKIKNNPEFVECRRSMETQRISHREAEKRTETCAPIRFRN